MRRIGTFALVAATVALMGAPLSAQLLPARASSGGWAPILVGARFGYDYNSTGSVAGAQLRIPVVRSGMVEVVPNGEISFLTGLKEYQYGVDAVYVSGGTRGGIYLGGGLGWRNSIFETTITDTSKRETRTTPMVVAGIRTGAIFGGITSQLELRWIYVKDTNLDPRVLTLGIDIPLWGWGSR